MAAKKLFAHVEEKHNRVTLAQLDPPVLREIILEGLKRRGINVEGSAYLHFWGGDTSGPLQAGPACSVRIERKL